MEALANALKGTAALVAAMGGDRGRIVVYDDTYPIGVNFQRALHELPSPGILLRYRGLRESEPGFRFSHAVALYARPQAGDAYSGLIYLVMTGTPIGQPLELMNMSLLSGLNPMRLEGDFAPVVDDEGVEYLEVNLRFEES